MRVRALLPDCAHVLRMLKGLKDHRVWTHRRPPNLVWSVQGFNLFNLRNTGITANELLASLRNIQAFSKFC